MVTSRATSRACRAAKAKRATVSPHSCRLRLPLAPLSPEPQLVFQPSLARLALGLALALDPTPSGHVYPRPLPNPSAPAVVRLRPWGRGGRGGRGGAGVLVVESG